jgi:DMSO/TMAO reductase YedYZ molybdopterin-dependent catalytic subunit
VISLQPPGAKDVMVGLFGTNDKLALNLLVVAAAVAIAAGAGILAAGRFGAGATVFVVFGAVAGFAAVEVTLAPWPLALLSAVVAVAAALVVLRILLGLAPRAVPPAPDPAWTRRRFLIASAGTLGGVIVAGGVGRALVQAEHGEGVVTSTKLPAPLVPVAALTPDQALATAGLTPLVTPTDDFYRIDTSLLVPQVAVESWQLRVSGMVDHPLTFSYDELLAMPLYEQYVTIACVSNRVGEHLVGNALWTGARLKDVLEAASVQPGATQVVGRSVDGFTVGFPTSWATAPGREPLIAVGMGREPLPAAHGFPARLIVPGLYGYVSATKWLTEIQLTTRDAVDGYWVPLGWAKDAPILTQSRIDVPRDGQDVAAGPIEIAGVAWAPDRGVTGVEIRIDDGAWQPARVTRPISGATWVQWVLSWTAPPGAHNVEVRAIDGTGETQTDQVTPPAPDGARGHHRILFYAG